MNIGIIGDATRGVAWESHLRPHNIVKQVVLAPSLHDIDSVDACFILDESDQNLDILLDAIHRGLNCFFVAKQPTDVAMLEKIHRATKEAGVIVQFAHWPVLAPASQWMMDKMHRPSIIQIEKHVNKSQFINLSEEFEQFWFDELGLCLKWIDSGVHHIEAREVRLSKELPVMMHIFIRFDNGSTATIHLNSAASENRHIRTISDRNQLFECDVPSQTIRRGQENASHRLYFNKQLFDASKSAEKAALLFLKSIQLNKESPFNSYDCLRLALHIDKVKQRLIQF
jgi:hypothetical protein